MDTKRLPSSSELSEYFHAANRFKSVRDFTNGNSWLNKPFVAITTHEGNKFAIYFEEGELKFLSANAGGIHFPEVIDPDPLGLNRFEILTQVDEFQRDFYCLAPVSRPNFTQSTPGVRRTSEVGRKVFDAWVLPLVAGSIILFLAFLGSLGTSSTPQLQTTPNSNTSQLLEQGGNIGEPSPPSLPSVEAPTLQTPTKARTIDTSPGFTVFCKDGTISNAGGKQGACSWHGGVR